MAVISKRLGIEGALVIALGLILDITGALHVYGLGSLMGQRLAAGSAVALVLIAVEWLCIVTGATPFPLMHRFTQRGQGIPQPLQRQLLLALILATWCAVAYDYMVFLSPGVTTVRILLCGGFALVLLRAIFRPIHTGWIVTAVVLAGSTLRLINFKSMPLDPTRSDMLPLVQQALQNFVAGREPYTLYSMPWELPLTYLPATWLTYLPAYVLGIDIRYTNLAAELAVGALLAWLCVTLRAAEDPTTNTRAMVWQYEPALLLWAWSFIQPTALHWSLSTTAPIFWLLLSLVLVLTTLRPENSAGPIVLGITLAASPLALLVLPFIAIRWYRTQGARALGRRLAIVVISALILILPFMLRSPRLFLFGTWQWFNDNSLFPRLRWDMDNTWAVMTGFSGFFWRHGLENLLKPIQTLILGALIWIYWRTSAQSGQLVAILVATFLLFTVFNPILWPYLYSPAMIATLIGFGIITTQPIKRYPQTKESPQLVLT